MCLFYFSLSLVELAAKNIQQDLQRRKSEEDAWNNNAIDLVKASDVSLGLCGCVSSAGHDWHSLDFFIGTCQILKMWE